MNAFRIKLYSALCKQKKKKNPGPMTPCAVAKHKFHSFVAGKKCGGGGGAILFSFNGVDKHIL